jgi:hypothetical protein
MARGYTRFLAWMHLLPNHGVFFALFLWRAATKSSDVSLERTLDVETQTICAVLGCDPPATSALVFKAYRNMFANVGIDADDVGHAFFYYMTLEGVIHGLICAGAVQVLMGGASTLYRRAMLAELVIMDVVYTVGYFVVPYGCAKHISACFGEDASSLSFEAGLGVATFVLTLAWLQHVSVLLDVLAYADLVMEAESESAGVSAAKKRK